MPSKSLLAWQTRRARRLDSIDAQNAALAAAPVPDPDLIAENLCGYALRLGAHFQGFCRALHRECVMAVAAIAPLHAQGMIQMLCGAGLELDRRNASFHGIRADFERFGAGVAALAKDPALAPHVSRLDHLNGWRNYAAHDNETPPANAGALDLPTLRRWRAACDALAVALDALMYDHLKAALGVAPW